MNDELQELLRVPREDLDIELKRWMDPLDKVVQAKFAKELIALQNHGGGYLVIGFRDEHPPVADPDRPASLEQFSTDLFNNILKKYAEPSFHCTSHVVAHPVTGELYPVVSVPGGSRVPVRCKADGPDGGKSIKLDTYYTRRPGPESSPPQSGAEWDALLQRCLLNRKDELLVSLSSLLGGGQTVVPVAVSSPSAVSQAVSGTGSPAVTNPFAELQAFQDAALSRLEHLQATKLPEDDPAQFKNGKYVLSARIVGNVTALSPKAMVDTLAQLRRYTGWSPLHVFSRPELAPYPSGDGIIECWLARDESRDVAHADFWRVSTEGLVTLVRGHQEDAPEIAGQLGSPAPGKGIEVTLPPWRVAEFLLRVRELGERISSGPFRIQVIAQWEGLEGRRLFSHQGRRAMSDVYVAHDPACEVKVEVSSDEVDAALPAVVSRIVTPLLRRFSFFEPPANFYEEELRKLLRKELV